MIIQQSVAEKFAAGSLPYQIPLYSQVGRSRKKSEGAAKEEICADSLRVTADEVQSETLENI